MTKMDKRDNSVSLLAWVYNEEELIGEFLDRAIGLLEGSVVDFEIVVVDDGSTDRTPEILEMYSRGESRLRIVTHPRNLNVGWAMRTAIGSAKKECLFWQTVDWSYDLGNVRLYLDLLKHYDVVQGVRLPREGRLDRIPVLRRIVSIRFRSDTAAKAIISLVNYYVLRLLFGVPLRDFQNVTFYPTRLVQSLNIEGRTGFVNPEMLIKAYAGGARVVEVPITFIPRVKGRAKGTRIRSVLRTVWDIVRNWIRWGIGLRVKMLIHGRGRIDHMDSLSSTEGLLRSRRKTFRTIAYEGKPEGAVPGMHEQIASQTASRERGKG